MEPVKPCGLEEMHMDGIVDMCAKKNPLAPMGVLAPGSAHARPSPQPPTDTGGNFSAQVS